MEFGYGSDIGEKGKNLPGHFLIAEAQVDDILEEGKEGEGGSKTTGLGNMTEESKADFIGEDRDIAIFENLDGFGKLFSEYVVFFVDIIVNFFQFFFQNSVMIYH